MTKLRTFGWLLMGVGWTLIALHSYIASTAVFSVSTMIFVYTGVRTWSQVPK